MQTVSALVPKIIEVLSEYKLDGISNKVVDCINDNGLDFNVVGDNIAGNSQAEARHIILADKLVNSLIEDPAGKAGTIRAIDLYKMVTDMAYRVDMTRELESLVAPVDLLELCVDRIGEFADNLLLSTKWSDTVIRRDAIMLVSGFDLLIENTIGHGVTIIW